MEERRIKKEKTEQMIKKGGEGEREIYEREEWEGKREDNDVEREGYRGK